MRMKINVDITLITLVTMCLILADNGYNIVGYKNVFKTKRELIWSFFKIVIKMIVFKLMVLTEKLMI